ncbi:MAG: oligosaccharide flippase family protein [Bacteroidales bacterium]|jgi:O-antigen/teichoic acid export membrane protein|nr:oligosaccharide flippase family protein [Bacteroidales bacterium]
MGVIIRQSIKGTIVNYIGAFVGFLTTFFIITKFLTAEELGLTRILLDASMLFVGLAQFGTTSSIIRFYPYFHDDKKKDHGFFGWTLLLPLFGFLIVLALYFIFHNTIAGYFATNSQLFVDYYYYVIPLAFALMYIGVFETNSNVLMRIVIPKAIREIAIRLGLIVVYLLYAFKYFTLTEFIIAFCVVYGLALLLNVFYLFSLQRVSLKPDFHFITKLLRKDIFLYTLFVTAVAITTVITPKLNSFFISAKMGLDFTGVFAIAGFFTAIIEIPYRSLGAISQPQISHAIKINDTKKANELCQSVSLHQLLAGGFILFFIWTNIDVIYQILPQGKIYADGKWAVLFLGFYSILNSTLSIGITVLAFSKHYYYSIFFSLFLTIAAIMLNLWLIPILGITGAAIATLAANVAYFALLLLLVNFKTKVNPFSFNQIKIVIIFAFIVFLNFLWDKFALHFLLTLSANTLLMTIIGRLLGTIITITIGVILVYKINISIDVNLLINRYLFRKI